MSLHQTLVSVNRLFYTFRLDVEFEMVSRQILSVGLGTLTLLLVLGLAPSVIPSSAPVSGCPPCGYGFTWSAENHGLDTEVQHSEATVRIHENGSASWTARVVPMNESVLNRLDENRSLARAVAADSFNYGKRGGIEHELISADVTDGAFVIRYRTLGVVSEGPFGTQVLTYFRDPPGGYVYVNLGADELTIVAPPRMTVARGFGNVTGDRMTATELPGVRDGPFVVFASEGSAIPGLLGALAVIDALWGVIVRNVLLFVAVPGGVLVGGFAGIRRFLNPKKTWDPIRLGSLVAGSGAVLLVGTVVAEGDVLSAVTGNLLLGSFGGAILVALGASVAVSTVRRYLTGLRLAGIGVAIGIGVLAVTDGLLGMSAFHRSLSLAAGLLPVAVALGWIDARDTTRTNSHANRLFIGLSVAIVGLLATFAPLTALGGTLFLLVPMLLTVVTVAVVIVAIPLYLLGAAGANADLT